MERWNTKTPEWTRDVKDNHIQIGTRVAAANLGRRRIHGSTLMFGTVIDFIDADVDQHEAIIVLWDNHAYAQKIDGVAPEDMEGEEIYRTHDYYDYEGFFDVIVVAQEGGK